MTRAMAYEADVSASYPNAAVERAGISAVSSQRRADAHLHGDSSRDSRYACVLSPLTELHAAHSSCRFS